VIMCKFNKGVKRKAYKTCCGGKKRLVEIYACDLKGEVEWNDCRKCRDFVVARKN
jgi:hypothetical protein